jgi:peptidoglycan/LPS O-acetylase OafA/YrhL
VTRYYRPELDALRFIAFLCVFCFHRMDYVALDAARHPWFFAFSTVGAFGVPVFFLLSAFLITELLMRERDLTDTIHVRSFYMRRVLRIWPLYFAVFYGLAVLNHFLPGAGPTRSSFLPFSLFYGNWYILRHGWIANPVDPLWSISVEEQFYIAIPLIGLLGGRKGIRIVSGLLLIVAYLLVLRYALHPTTGDNGEWTDSLVQFQFFSAGTLLSLALRGRLPQMPLSVRLAGVALGFACWLTALLQFGVKSWDAHPTAAGALAGWALVLLGSVLLFLSWLGTPERFIPGWLAYLGRVSYGLYVFHALMFWLVFDKGIARGNVGTAIVMVATIVVAHLSYRFFERPFLRLKGRFTFVRAREDDVVATAGA